MDSEEDDYVEISITHDREWWEDLCDSILYLCILQESLGLQVRGSFVELRSMIQNGLRHAEEETTAKNAEA